MAERRMFAKTLIDSDVFLDMPLSTQALYFHLSMRADDDGFINNPKKIQRILGCSDDDLKLLIAKKFIIPFESGVVVIKHWKIHNYIRKDRYNETAYKEEKGLLIENDGVYSLNANGIPLVDQTDTQRLPQVRLGKVSIGNKKIYSRADSTTEPNYREIIDYLNIKTGKSYKYTTAKTKSCIEARYKEGFTLEDFKTVIDIKTIEWLNDSKMNKFLRPETLFSNKFEGYLNQKDVKLAEQSKPNKFHNFDNKIPDKIASMGEDELADKLKKKWGK